MERLKAIRDSLVDSVAEQICHLPNVDTRELGEAVDMIKDMEEAIYYHVSAAAACSDGLEEKIEGFLIQATPEEKQSMEKKINSKFHSM